MKHLLKLLFPILILFSACGEKEKEITVESIAISQPSAELVIGETLPLKATVSPSNASYDGITWTSTKTTVATVSDSGLVSALSEGNTTITVMAGGKTASCDVTVIKGFIAVTSISLNRTLLELFEGDTEILSAKVSPNDATDKTISWSSSNTGVATVKDGTITAIKEGEATITAKAGERTASCKVVVISYPSPDAIDLGLSVKWASFNLDAFSPEEYGDYYAWGSIIPYYESLDPLIWLSEKEAGYSWSSYNYCRGSYNTLTKYCSDPSYGYNGFTDNKSILEPYDDVAYCALGDKWRMPTISEMEELITMCSWKWTYYNGVKGYKVTGSNGNSIFLPAAGWWLEKTLNDDDSAGMYWSSTSLGTSAKYLLDFSKQGIVCNSAAFIIGCTIRPVYGDPTSSIPVQSVSLDKSQLDLTVGQTYTLTATVKPSNATNKSVTWSSSNTSVATVSSSGVISAKAAGNATITVKTNDGGKTATCTVKVTTSKVVVTGVSLNKTSLSITVGESQSLTATVSPSNATDKSVTWSSSNTSVATVSSSGVISAKAAGNATITVKTNDGGKTATCTVKVTTSKVVVTGVSLDKTSLSMTVGESQSLTATVSPSNATDKSVTWSSSIPSVATVSSEGVVTANTAGITIITVRTIDGGLTAKCEVTVKRKEVVNVTDIKLNCTSWSMAKGNTLALVATVIPSSATNKSVTWSSSNTSVATVSSLGIVTAKAVGEATITVKTNDKGKTASCTVKVIDVKAPEIVDLGLPSGLKWASFNLGASSELGIGYRPAWGELNLQKDNYGWNYKWGSGNYFIKYNTDSSFGDIDNKTVLDLDDDAAHVLLGGNWRMPTEAEWRELIVVCTFTVFRSPNGEAFSYVVFTGPNGNSIKLPYSGRKEGLVTATSTIKINYWSSSLNATDPKYAYSLAYDAAHPTKEAHMSVSLRCYGLAIRPVYDESL